MHSAWRAILTCETCILAHARRYFERPPPGENVIVVSYSTNQRDAMWEVVRNLNEAGYLVFNGDQIKPGEEWDQVFFDTCVALLARVRVCVHMWV